MSAASETDVLVIGGGPAGAVTALALARGGHSVWIVERGAYAEARIGETLPPPAYAILGELGLKERFHAHAHGRSHVLRSAWTTPTPTETDYGSDPHGPWWHLDRQRFDLMLADAAVEAGATVARGARVRIQEHRDASWHAEVITAERAHRLRARFVVDATGRACSFARAQGAKRVARDALVGVAGVPSSLGDSSFYTMAEATEEGWWYSALLPGDRYVAIFMTDTELLPKGRAALADFWRKNLDRAPHTRERVTDATLPSEPRVVSANSARLDALWSSTWVAVGDAGLSFDPLSSLGLWHGLDSGWRAAYAISMHLAGEAGALAEYGEEEEQVFSRYLESRSAQYRRVTRWPDAPFWKARRSA